MLLAGRELAAPRGAGGARSLWSLPLFFPSRFPLASLTNMNEAPKPFMRRAQRSGRRGRRRALRRPPPGVWYQLAATVLSRRGRVLRARGAYVARAVPLSACLAGLRRGAGVGVWCWGSSGVRGGGAGRGGGPGVGSGECSSPSSPAPTFLSGCFLAWARRWGWRGGHGRPLAGACGGGAKCECAGRQGGGGEGAAGAAVGGR